MNLLNLIFGVTNEHTHSLVVQTKTIVKVGDRILVKQCDRSPSEKKSNGRNDKNHKNSQHCVCHSDIIIAGTNPVI